MWPTVFPTTALLLLLLLLAKVEAFPDQGKWSFTVREVRAGFAITIASYLIHLPSLVAYLIRRAVTTSALTVHCTPTRALLLKVSWKPENANSNLTICLH